LAFVAAEGSFGKREDGFCMFAQITEHRDARGASSRYQTSQQMIAKTTTKKYFKIKYVHNPN